MSKQIHWVIDYETLKNCTILCAEHYKEDIEKHFVIARGRNDILQLVSFLEECRDNNQWHISFNGLAFDSQITEFILREGARMYYELEDPELIANEIYKIAQNVIERQSMGIFLEYYERSMSIRNIDVFKLNHWDNPAKRSSLKWIQYSMDWHNIKEMPIHHSTMITTEEQITEILTYCRNDIKSTKNIFFLSKNQIALRKSLTEQYGINLYSASEPKISRSLFLQFLSKRTGIREYELKQLRTHREIIDVGSIIKPDFFEFKTKEFQDMYDKFSNLKIRVESLKGSFKYSLKHKGVVTDLALGGVHGAARAGIYRSGNGKLIVTADVTSFYPMLAILNGWAPAHLPADVFCELYKWFFDERVKISKKDIRNYVYKIILNSTYGLSNEENSFLYDPEMTMRITVNGQLTLMMLYEMISLGLPTSVPLMQNTDGLEMMIDEQDYEKYMEICRQWESMTNLKLEHDFYEQMFIGDVNNYIAVYKEKSVDQLTYNEMKASNPHYAYRQQGGNYFVKVTKCKGRFEFHDLPLHKNKSFLIIRKAIYNYLMFGAPPEETLKNNRNIFDYCGGVKIKGDWFFNEVCYKKGIRKDRKLQNIVRYYVSHNGCKILKVNKLDGREINLVSGRWLQTEFNEFEEKDWKDYGINESYYLDQVYKELSHIEGTSNKNQLSLF